MAAQIQLVRDQHIVPQWHLKKFADTDGWLWRYKRNIPPKRSRPKGECWARDFYEYDVNGKRTENKFERWLRGIENDAAPVHEALVNGSQLSQADTIAWASYVASLFLRTQKVRIQISARMVEKFIQQTQSPDFIRELQYDLLNQGELVFAEDLRKQVDELRNKMESSPSYYHLSSLQGNTASLARALVAKAWHVLEAAPGKFFVLSDCPVTTAEIVAGRANAGTGFGRESTTVVVPLTPKYVFFASPPAVHWKLVGPPVAVDSTNLLTIRFAYERVYSHLNSVELRALIDGEINRITFGKNAFVPSDRN